MQADAVLARDDRGSLVMDAIPAVVAGSDPAATVLEPARPRLRDLGIVLGELSPGPHNAITDVRGVRVGHTTLIEGRGRLRVGQGPVRTGVTAIWPGRDDILQRPVLGGSFVLNGAGELAGLTQVVEWGTIETPILLTNTLAVGTVSEACSQWMLERSPGIGTKLDVIIPLVGECDDSWLNDVGGQHVRPEHVYAALEGATSGPVAEGNVGGGTGMMTCDFSGGIGTSSRRLPGGQTLGVLVMSNFGRMIDLRIGGVAVGRTLAPAYAKLRKRRRAYGSIIAVFATDTPLLPIQLNRVAVRVALGIGRAGSYAAHRSGEIVVGFSTANDMGTGRRSRVRSLRSLSDGHLDPLYRAAIECTEEAIGNALCAAVPLDGVNGHVAPACPTAALAEMWHAHDRLGADLAARLAPEELSGSLKVAR